jgi:hypothetical protein
MGRIWAMPGLALANSAEKASRLSMLHRIRREHSRRIRRIKTPTAGKFFHEEAQIRSSSRRKNGNALAGQPFPGGVHV